MHYIEPFYNWRGYYVASDDSLSPFFNVEYSELQYSNKIYNFYIHPQWDDIGSETLFLKILFVDYDKKTSVIELIGEWNDAIGNDVMTLKRDVVDVLINHGIDKFILIGENVLNFHYSDDCYYEEWFDDVEDGWISMVNFHEHVSKEFTRINVDQYVVMGGELDDIEWRTFHPIQFIEKVTKIVENRLN